MPLNGSFRIIIIILNLQDNKGAHAYYYPRLPALSLNKVFMHEHLGRGAFARLERGELPLGPDFYAAFAADARQYSLACVCTDSQHRVTHGRLDTRELFEAIGRGLTPNTRMLDAIHVCILC